MGFDDGAFNHVSFGHVAFASDIGIAEGAAGACKIHEIGSPGRRGDAQ